MPKDAATNILAEVWGNRGFPVDPVWIARQLGLDVIEAWLGNDVSGALVKKTDKDPIIVLNNSDHRNRQRFTCAHELGHYVQRWNNGADQLQYEFVDLRGLSAASGSNPEEIFANQFAANLLMPESEVKRLWREGLHPSVIASRFGVSDDAMRFRLSNLNIR